MGLKIASVAFLAALGAVGAHAQGPSDLAGPADLRPLEKPYLDPFALPLYPGVAPGSERSQQVEAWMSAPRDLVVRNVTKPTITPYMPSRANATGAAVIVMPGGGNVVLSMGKEGYDVAQFLANQGIAAFVVKYRLNESPADMSQMRPLAAGAVGAPGSGRAGAAPATRPPMPPPSSGPRYGVADGKEALRWVRAHAAQYGIDPQRVGMVGFSAGAGNIWGVVDDQDPTAMPSFFAPIYGGFGTRASTPSSPPPLFLAVAADDVLIAGHAPGFPVIEQWTKAGGKVEMHLYQNGGHGFGALKQGTSSDLFMEQFVLWMKVNGFLKPKS
ncbi:MAG: alpha/beta hydrolase [Gammaproteobacteria bacterium]|nr:alpha/beta hydrolase [Gammaproteobacteria bacterium]